MICNILTFTHPLCIYLYMYIQELTLTCIYSDCFPGTNKDTWLAVIQRGQYTKCPSSSNGQCYDKSTHAAAAKPAR